MTVTTGSFLTLKGTASAGIGKGRLGLTLPAGLLSCFPALTFLNALRSFEWILRSCFDLLLLDLKVCSQEWQGNDRSFE
jgi:hypothetical protein